jgi:hypothetical protein
MDKSEDQMIEEYSVPRNFIISITIIECVDLLLEDSYKEIPNSYVIIKVGNQEKSTDIKRENPRPKFEDKFDFILTTTVNELKTMKVLFSVWHKRRFYQRDTLIGNYSVDVWNVYSKSSRMINKVWGGLSNMEVINPGIIRYSIMVSSEGDNLIAFAGDMDEDEEMNNDGDTDTKKKTSGLKDVIQGKTALEVKLYQMSVIVYKGEFCAQMPGITELTSKFKIKVNEGDLYESNTISKSFTPKWNTQWNIPMRHPFYITYIIVDIMYEQSGSNQLGRILLDFNQLIRDGNLETKWYLIYGPQRVEDSFLKNLKYQWKIGKEAEQFFYYGRILASAKWLPDENPTKKKFDDISTTLPPPEIEYIFWLDIYELTSEVLSGNVYFEFQVGDVIKDKQATYNSNLKKYYLLDKEKRFHAEKVVLPLDVPQIPDIFIRVYKDNKGFWGGKEYIGYKRFKAADLLQYKWAVKSTWEMMRMCYTTVKGDCKENYLGRILCSINLFAVNPDDEVHKRPLLNDTNPMKRYKLISIIYLAHDLPVSSVLPNAVVKILFNGVEAVTDKKDEGSMNPHWGAGLTITTLLNDSLELSEHIKMQLEDHSPMFSPIFIGQAEIPIVSISKYNSQMYVENEKFKLAKWYHLYHGTTKLKTKVLAAFYLVKLLKESPEMITIPKQGYWPAMTKYRLFLFVIGIRQIPKTMDLTKGYVIASYKKQLEQVSDTKERFLFNPEKGYEIKFKKGIYDNNFNNLDILNDNGVIYKKIVVFDHHNFSLPLELSVYDEYGNVKLFTNIDISKHLEFSNRLKDVKRDIGNPDITFLDVRREKLKTFHKKKQKFIPTSDDLVPLYKETYLNDNLQTDKYAKLFQKTMNHFPFDIEEVSIFS